MGAMRLASSSTGSASSSCISAPEVSSSLRCNIFAAEFATNARLEPGALGPSPLASWSEYSPPFSISDSAARALRSSKARLISGSDSCSACIRAGAKTDTTSIAAPTSRNNPDTVGLARTNKPTVATTMDAAPARGRIGFSLNATESLHVDSDADASVQWPSSHGGTRLRVHTLAACNLVGVPCDLQAFRYLG